MSNPFFDHPIVNSPYECPSRHWELDDDGQPTQKITEHRRSARFVAPVPKPKKPKQAAAQEAFVFDEGKGSFHQGSAIRRNLQYQRGAPERGCVACVRAMEEERKAVEMWRVWFDRMPRCLSGLGIGEWREGARSIRDRLDVAYADASGAILDLLEWYGSGSSAWNAYPLHESTPRALL